MNNLQRKWSVLKRVLVDLAEIKQVPNTKKQLTSVHEADMQCEDRPGLNIPVAALIYANGELVL